MDYGKLALKKIEELYGAIYDFKSTETNLERKISVSYPNASGQTDYRRQLRFKTGVEGSITILLLFTVSRSVTLSISLDGEVVKTQTYTSSTRQTEIVCGGVPAGVHVVEFLVTGSSFTASNFNLSVTGKVVRTDGDVFIEGFESNKGYICLCLGRLEVYSFSTSSKTSTLVRTLYGIEKARTFESNGTHISCVTETGCACLILNALSSSPTFVYLISGAKAVCVLSSTDSEWKVFVSTQKGVKCFVYNVDSGLLLPCGGDGTPCSDLTAVNFQNKTYLFSVKSGSVGVAEALYTRKFSPDGRFTVSGKREI